MWHIEGQTILKFTEQVMHVVDDDSVSTTIGGAVYKRRW